jgi:hypothetical protein
MNVICSRSESALSSKSRPINPRVAKNTNKQKTDRSAPNQKNPNRCTATIFDF